MDSFKGPCCHRSAPVEMDESMTSSNLDLAWPPPCLQCGRHTETSKMPQEHGNEQIRGESHNAGRRRIPESQYHHEPKEAFHAAPQPCLIPPTHSGQMRHPDPADFWPNGLNEQFLRYERDSMAHHSKDFASASKYLQHNSLEEAESLEPPLPLVSDSNYTHYVRSPYSAGRMTGPRPIQEIFPGQCACCPPANLPRLTNNYHYYKNDNPMYPHQGPRHYQQSRNPPRSRLQIKDGPNSTHGSVHQCVAPLGDVIHEVSVQRSFQADPGPATREIRKTVSLPDECRNVFITYSVDIAGEMLPFAKFLTDQGFEPAIDIFDNPLRRMGITKWMDRYLNDKSVLIIVVISPKYKEDVEGDGDDEHGLHTKYIHNQIQNEFIQQGCLNFRLVPVLFPNATKRHVPNWLQSTRIYRWPQDTQDLLLRLLREERYIIPQRAADLTLTVRPL
ncbi:E3 ubiquitin ligase TRAF3IP2-like [Acanthopagrus latus]|uniref:E3 ubiquitin ligase TRAF3IP2-like n=1 Tax=Acanthopagrus latus TaxID=8177 RepID=UPI00187C61C9|nr:E3 ubiquitin ligase TRAF3IP2-like [Acanthopagrus latus]XP_036941768.1 E3 ubiquitin ligase TRAF3IP2-like [Acanthopagrus latus]XP_036941770.1 E3 ubiquitin ligase TRAF3IP2-like [Acanthopagrus latus]XP_036941771.1 E3 ubiquitin ligase TRAF3IP2-like [Acanthopagrus latus]XP_036941772.1 E3 ubiquitin ligase TRAF3IP2-like [Acanthopagrus latus]XP_036941773.1 E3 ubiquitin ligase TRAF3IP2-like [Acanthopagrus latus]XP_036941774.1 E3 ubiquitin ligase TRAF3IP2-like [Acanthopagrus latus]